MMHMCYFYCLILCVQRGGHVLLGIHVYMSICVCRRCILICGREY